MQGAKRRTDTESRTYANRFIARHKQAFNPVELRRID